MTDATALCCDLAMAILVLNKTPLNWSARLVYAEALEKCGKHDLAAAQRWMMANGQCPEQFTGTRRILRDGKLICESFRYWGWSSVSPRPGGRWQPSLERQKMSILDLRGYATRDDAEAAFASELAAMPEE